MDREYTSDELAHKMSINNPHDEPVGHYTGRCRHCGSQDLWEDIIAYGCNECGAVLLGN